MPAIQYEVHFVRHPYNGDFGQELEDKCTEMARLGWRLVSTEADIATPSDRSVRGMWLFFEEGA